MRPDSGLTQEQVAAELEWSPSKLIRVEGGRSSITKVDLDALLAKYGVTSESARERLQALNRGAREPAWWDKYREDVASTYLAYVGFEAGAAFIRQFQTLFVPGLLQTADYAEAVTVKCVGDGGAQHVEPVQGGFGVDLALPAGDGEAVVGDGEVEVLAGLVLADHLAGLDPDRPGSGQLAGLDPG